MSRGTIASGMWTLNVDSGVSETHSFVVPRSRPLLTSWKHGQVLEQGKPAFLIRSDFWNENESRTRS